jgi:hypothetical protein
MLTRRLCYALTRQYTILADFLSSLQSSCIFFLYYHPAVYSSDVGEIYLLKL